jgi:hypothetical protein
VGYYHAYGLRIESELPLPEFLAAEAGGDVVIRFAEPNSTPLEPLVSFVQVTPEEAILSLAEIGAFRIRAGSEITIRLAPGVETSLLQLYLVGTVMALLLYQRGFLVLHASAVEVDGSAVAFLGVSGAGKSSTAAALHTRGHRIVADDVVPVDLKALRPMASPGFPQLKLYPTVAHSLGYHRQSLRPLHSKEGKQGCRVAREFSPSPLLLRHLYVLESGPVPHIEPLCPQQALIELIRHSYPTRLLHCGGVAHFQQCARLLQQIPVYHLQKPDDPAALPDLVRQVEAHLAAGGQQPHAATHRNLLVSMASL